MKIQHRSALRRVVSIVATVGMAAATAVIVAPSASAAWSGTHDNIIRATPLADAAYVDATGNPTGTGGFATYGATHATGFARLVGQDPALPASNIQISLASDTGATGLWAASDVVTLTLPAGVSFTAPPVASTDVTNLPSGAIGSVTAPGSTATIPLTAADPGNNPANTGYLLSVSGISVTVPTSFTGPLAMTVTTPSGTHNTTTIGYVAPLTLTAPAMTVTPGSASQALPVITLGELVKSGLAAGSDSLTITGGTAAFDITNPASVTAAGMSGISITGPVTSSSNVTWTVASPSATTQESVAISGLHVIDVQPGIPVKITLNTGGFAANNGSGSTFSFAPALANPAVEKPDPGGGDGR
ncbi:MAG: hypothetical protein ABI382_11250 [Nakamurella sp.]